MHGIRSTAFAIGALYAVLIGTLAAPAAGAASIDSQENASPPLLAQAPDYRPPTGGNQHIPPPPYGIPGSQGFAGYGADPWDAPGGPPMEPGPYAAPPRFEPGGHGAAPAPYGMGPGGYPPGGPEFVPEHYAPMPYGPRPAPYEGADQGPGYGAPWHGMPDQPMGPPAARGHHQGARHGMGRQLWHRAWALDLSHDQRNRILDIHDEKRRIQWEFMGERMEHASQLRRLYAKDRLDPTAIGKVYGRLFDVRRRMIESTLEANNQILDVLTDAQRQRLEASGTGAPPPGMH